MRTNKKTIKGPVSEGTTHEGAPAAKITATAELRRSVLSCLLFENTHYEDGVSIADRITELATNAPAQEVADLAIEAREQMNLRHVPLLLCAILCRTGSGSSLVSDTIERVIKRPDEIGELISLYWKVNGKRVPLSKQLKLGTRRAYNKFDAYQITKYANRDDQVSLRDAMFMVHPKPSDDEKAKLFEKLASKELRNTDTWEAKLSAGEDANASFTDLIKGNRLGYLALLRNLRKMEEKGVDREIVKEAILARRGANKVLPFRFFAAAKEAPRFETEINQALVGEFSQGPKLPGKTIVVLDVSGSMMGRMGTRSSMTLLDAGAALAAVVAGQCEEPVVYATAGSDWKREHKTRILPVREGMAMRDAFLNVYDELGGGGIFLKPCLDYIKAAEKTADRIVVITDEQDCSIDQKDSPLMAAPFGRTNYLINVASYKRGVGYGKWVHIDGFSEAVVKYMLQYESPNNQVAA